MQSLIPVHVELAREEIKGEPPRVLLQISYVGEIEWLRLTREQWEVLQEQYREEFTLVESK